MYRHSIYKLRWLVLELREYVVAHGVAGPDQDILVEGLILSQCLFLGRLGNICHFTIYCLSRKDETLRG